MSRINRSTKFGITVLLFLVLSATVIAGQKQGGMDKRGKPAGPAARANIKSKPGIEEKVRVLIKVKAESDDPSISRMATASDPDRFISKSEIKRLQKKLENSFSVNELAANFKINHKLDNIPWMTGTITGRALAKLEKHPNVAMIAPDETVKAVLAESAPLMGSGTVNGFGVTGGGVTVAVIDTGIDTDHPDLLDDLLREECFLAGGGCPGGGGTRAGGPGSAEDGDGHGTHVSGIISSGHSTYSGVAPDAGLVALKTLDDTGTGFSSDIIAAIDWATSNKDTYGIRIINMSLGFGPFAGQCDSSGPAFSAAVDAAKGAGITLFAASGNDGVSNGIAMPACLSSVISVGAVYDADVGGIAWSNCTDFTTQADQVGCFSNVSSVLDVLAPGALINSSGLGGGIGNLNGTSMASSHAAGVAALMIQDKPSLTPDEIQNILKITGRLIQDSRVGMDFPRIDAVSAVNYNLTYELTITTSGTGTGVVTGAGIYNSGDMAAVSATPDPGSMFGGWSGPDAGDCSMGSVLMNRDKSCVAAFDIIPSTTSTSTSTSTTTTSTSTTTTLPPLNSDLAITISDSPDPVDAGQVLTYTIIGTNNGPDGVTGSVSIGHSLTVFPLSITSDKGSCTIRVADFCPTCPDYYSHCSFQDMGVGESVVVTLEVGASAETTSNTASIHSTNINDPDTSNNLATENTTVQGAGGDGGGIRPTIVRPPRPTVVRPPRAAVR